jgi:hypothetical protein
VSHTAPATKSTPSLSPPNLAIRSIRTQTSSSAIPPKILSSCPSGTQTLSSADPYPNSCHPERSCSRIFANGESKDLRLLLPLRLLLLAFAVAVAFAFCSCHCSCRSPSSSIQPKNRHFDRSCSRLREQRSGEIRFCTSTVRKFTQAHLPLALPFWLSSPKGICCSYAIPPLPTSNR